MMVKFRDWVEPAHPGVIKRYDDLVQIFKYLRGELQGEIDSTFDRVARQIGFVVTTTLPVTLQIDEGAKIKSIELGSANLGGTLFEREFVPIFKRLIGKPVGEAKVAAGSYKLVFIWFDALKIKLKHDWVEPAHFREIRLEIAEELAARVRPEVQEPAHWFDGGIALAQEEEVLIAVIDEVYPELRLADRVAISRQNSRALIPGVREPAHYKNIIEGVLGARYDVRRPIPGVREPAHFGKIADWLENPEKVQLLSELSAILKKLGF